MVDTSPITLVITLNINTVNKIRLSDWIMTKFYNMLSTKEAF